MGIATKFLIAVCLSTSVLISTWGKTSSAQSSEAERAAEQRARELADLFTAGDAGAFNRYAAANLSPDLLKKVPLAQYFASIWDTTRGVDIRRFEDPKTSEVTAIMQARLTEGWLAFTISVEPAPPYRITNFPVRLLHPLPAARAGPPLSNAQIAQELGTYMSRLAAADVFSGAVLLAKDGVSVFSAAYGQANKDFGMANATNTRFNLGSMNKMFTAVAIAQLVEQGKLTFEMAGLDATKDGKTS